LKKKYNLPFGASGKSASDSPKKASDAAGPNEPAVPKTPSKNKVTKPRMLTLTENNELDWKVLGATPSSKKTPKGKKVVKEEVEEDAVNTGDDEDELAGTSNAQFTYTEVHS